MAAPPPPVHAQPSPHARLPGAKPYRATRDPNILPVPFVPFPAHLVDDPRFAPRPPAGRPFMPSEIPTIKLRGLGPADSIILRHAVARHLFDPRRLYLAPLLPWTPPPAEIPPPGVDRHVPTYPDVPLQPDVIYARAATTGPTPGPPPLDVRAPAGAPPTYPDYGHRLLIEIKPNAGYVAVGQVLAYHWAWTTHFGGSWPLRAAILTDLARPYLPDLCTTYGIQLIAVGDLIVEPPPWPT